MWIWLASGRQLDSHSPIELLSEQTDAQNAREFSRRIRDHLLHADFCAALRLGQFHIELGPMQIAPQKPAGKIFPRGRGERGMQCRITDWRS